MYPDGFLKGNNGVRRCDTKGMEDSHNDESVMLKGTTGRGDKGVIC